MLHFLRILFLYVLIHAPMQKDLQKIEQAAAGLQFLSETNAPFELVEVPNPSVPLEQQLLRISGKEEGTPVARQDLDYFFRNAVKSYPGASPEGVQTAQRFQYLQQVLKEELSDVQVYRVGEIQIDAFIIGKLKDGSYAGLRTKVVET